MFRNELPAGYVCTIPFYTSAKNDQTEDLSQLLYSVVNEVTKAGLPSRFEFHVMDDDVPTKQAMYKLTLPVIPASYKTETIEDMLTFLTDATSQTCIQYHTSQIDPQSLEKMVKKQTKELLTYLQFDLQDAYAFAKHTGDTAFVHQLDSMAFAKTFDIGLTSRITKGAKFDGLRFKFDYLYSSKQAPEDYNSHMDIVSRYNNLRKRFIFLTNGLYDFENREFEKDGNVSIKSLHSIFTSGPLTVANDPKASHVQLLINKTPKISLRSGNRVVRSAPKMSEDYQPQGNVFGE